MNILGIDSSGTVASAAVLSDDKLVVEFSSDTSFTHSKSLLPMIDMALKAGNVDKKEIDVIAVASGPGSFTGLRIGAGTVKGLAMALDCKIIAVPTLDALAYRIPMHEQIVCPIMNARRSQVYTSAYTWENKKYTQIFPQMACDIRELLEKLSEYNKKVIFIGDGISEFKEIIENEFKGSYEFAPLNVMKQSAAAVAMLGKIMYDEGKTVEISEFKPEYLRQSQAEREKQEKDDNKKNA